MWQALSPPLAHPLDYKELPWVEPEVELRPDLKPNCVLGLRHRNASLLQDINGLLHDPGGH